MKRSRVESRLIGLPVELLQCVLQQLGWLHLVLARATCRESYPVAYDVARGQCKSLPGMEELLPGRTSWLQLLQQVSEAVWVGAGGSIHAGVLQAC